MTAATPSGLLLHSLTSESAYEQIVLSSVDAGHQQLQVAEDA